MSTTLAQHARRGGLVVQLLFVAYTQAGVMLSAGAAVLLLVVAWVLCQVGGGSSTPWPHAFYAAIILAAVRFSWAGAALAAVAAGLLAGPLLPVDISTQRPQALEAWLFRLLAFLLIGLFVAALMRRRAEDRARAPHDSLLSVRLIRAIQREHVHVHYQPIYDLHTGSIAGLEALARWQDPTHGPIAPGEFIPAAERTGAVAVLDGYVLRAAAAQARQWQALTGRALTMSVNVSAARFTDPALLDETQRILGRSGLQPSTLQLEVTESALIGDIPAAARQIDRLRSLGVRVAIDDFGTGQASLSYLDQFHVDTVKLDRSLISRSSGPRGAQLLEGVADLMGRLGVDVVAEGIEEAAHTALLREAGVGFGQGYHLGRPLAADRIPALLATDIQARPLSETGERRPR